MTVVNEATSFTAVAETPRTRIDPSGLRALTDAMPLAGLGFGRGSLNYVFLE